MKLFALFTSFLFFLTLSVAEAAYITMASAELNGSDSAEIIRTESKDELTVIKIYEKIENSYFYRPAQEFKVPGHLVQVPNLQDFTGDSLNDIYFATGADMGVIYYDTAENTYKRDSNIEPFSGMPYHTQEAVRESNEEGMKESDILLKMELGETPSASNDVSMKSQKVARGPVL